MLASIANTLVEAGRSRGRSSPPAGWTARTAFAVCTLVALGLRGGEAPKVLVIRGARIVSPSAGVIENGAILIEADRIKAVGQEVPGAGVAGIPVPQSAAILDASGKTVTPGCIDVHSSLGLASGGSGPGGATKRAADAFDCYASAISKGALASGVTAVHVTCGGPVGLQGVDAVIRLVPGTGGAAGEVLAREASLAIDLGSGSSALSRISIFSSIRGQFRAALDHRESLEVYREDIAEYEKKLKERVEKKGREKAKEKEKEKEFRETGEPKPDAAVPPTPQGPGEAKPGAEPRKPEAEELKKPARPRRNPPAEVLLRAIDRKLSVWIEAHRSEDILNSLGLGNEFGLDLVLVGATEAHLVADEIAAAGARVVLGSQILSETSRQAPYRRLAEVGAVLSRSGVRWWVGSGAESGLDARFVLLNAQVAAAAAAASEGVAGGDIAAGVQVSGGARVPGEARRSEVRGSAASEKVADAFSLVTVEAARLLGLQAHIGDVRPGLLADLVIWSGDPRDPGSRVERVIVGGRLAYEAPGEEAKR